VTALSAVADLTSGGGHRLGWVNGFETFDPTIDIVVPVADELSDFFEVLRIVACFVVAFLQRLPHWCKK
jgi:hypothetical protein